MTIAPRLLSVALVLFSVVARADERPNILFLFSDDQSYETVGAVGLAGVRTPNLDRLYREGTVFTHAYNMGGYHGAVCVASRTMINTGLFVWHARRADNLMKEGQWDRPLWAQRMKRAGYDTYFTGKWHVSAKADGVFDVAKHIRGGMPDQTPEGYNRPLDGQSDPWSPSDPSFGGFWKGGTHWSEVVADDAEEFLARAAGSDNPFFMYIAFNAPHDPRQSPQEFVDRYPVDRIALPANFLPEYPCKDQIGCSANLRDEKLAPFPRTEYAVKVHRREYFAIIEHMDEQIGRILAALERTGQKENTYIFFTSDHGLACGRHGLLGKQNMYDHSVRVPFVAVGEKFEPGRRISVPIYLQDVLPTTLELTGADRPDDMQFQSLLPLISGERDRQYEAIYGCYINHQRMIVQDGYKLIVYPDVPQILLFNLERDPEEMQNLADDPRHADRIRKLFAKLQVLQNESGDKLDLTAAFADLES